MPPSATTPPSSLSKKQLKARLPTLLWPGMALLILIFCWVSYLQIISAGQTMSTTITSIRREKIRAVATLKAHEVASWLAAQKAMLGDIGQLPFVQHSLSRPGLQHDQQEAATFGAQAQGWINFGRSPQIALKDRVGAMVLFDHAQRIEYTIPDNWQPSPIFSTVMQDAMKSGTAQFDVILDENHIPVMAFALPVTLVDKGLTTQNFAPQPNMAAQQIGVILAIKPLPEFLQSMVQGAPGERDRSYSVELLQPFKDSAVIIVGPPGTTGSHLVNHSELDPATAYGLDNPGLDAIKTDAAGKDVIVTGEVLKEAPSWVMIAQATVDGAEVINELDSAILRFTLGMLVALGAVGAAGWYLLVKRGILRGLQKASIKANRSNDSLVQIVANRQLQALTLYDRSGRVLFANIPAANQARKKPAEMLGRTIEEVLGKAMAGRAKSRIQEALQSKAPVIATDHVGSAAAPRILQSTIIPIINAQNPSLQGAALISIEDVTKLVSQGERTQTVLRQIIDTLIAIVDRRDPHASGHSIYVGQISREIATVLGLDRQQVETAETAGLLMNFGKVLVPRSILNKAAPLTPEELLTVREGILASSDILSIIDFELPVVPTLRQVLERVDGLGLPDGRKGDTIIVTARIVTIANAFISLISSRPHRPRRNIDDAILVLEQEAGTAYDPRVVKALGEYLNNRGGREIWSKIFEENAAADTPPPAA